MRSLAQTKVLTQAGLAALATLAFGYPRLAAWPHRTEALLILCLLLLWSAFVLWAFVFAWPGNAAGPRPFQFPRSPRLWGLATGYAALATVWLHGIVDPRLRITTPGDYPLDLPSWAAMSLFMLAFEPLFLYFAPFAVWSRLCRRPAIVWWGTVLFGVFVFLLKLQSLPVLPPPSLFALMILVRVATGCLTLYFYIRGGVWLVWWLIFLTQLRHLPALFHA